MANDKVFFGRRVLMAAFVLAVFGWGVGFYGPAVFLHAVVQRTGWPVALVSAAVTLHFLAGAFVVACLPAFHARFGTAPVTAACAVLLAAGTLGWAGACAPWQLFAAAGIGGAGWAGLGAAAVNAVISPWYVRRRPAALGTAYNGASVGGVVFSPLWVLLIGSVGFVPAAAAVGGCMVLVIGALAAAVFSRTPAQLGQWPDGDAAGEPPAPPAASAPPAGALWRDRRFLTLAAGMSLGLFAQIGLIAHLYSLLAPGLGVQYAGVAMGAATAMAIVGRTLTGRLLSDGRSADRRTVACAAYAVQAAGSLLLLGSEGNPALLWTGLLLFGSGIGNATSLPPLIAQTEFARALVPRVVALIVAVSQACYAFAPAAFGAVRECLQAAGRGQAGLFALVALIQLAAIIGLRLGALAARGCPPESARRPLPRHARRRVGRLGALG